MARVGTQAVAENPQGLTHGDRRRMSGLLPKADIERREGNVSFVPLADLRTAANFSLFGLAAVPIDQPCRTRRRTGLSPTCLSEPESRVMARRLESSTLH